MSTGTRTPMVWHRAACTCGWLGPWGAHIEQAKADAREHGNVRHCDSPFSVRQRVESHTYV